MTNPFFEPFNTAFEVPPFDVISEEHFLPAIKKFIGEAKTEIDAITSNDDPPTFENTILSLEDSGEKLSVVTSVLFNLNSAETTSELQGVAQEASPLLTEFNADIKQDKKLFERIKNVYQTKEDISLTDEEHMLLEKTYKSFVRNGSDLGEEEKKKFKEISVELSKLTLTFGENVLAETNDYKLVVDDEKKLSGLPADVKSRAAKLAESIDLEGNWVFTLQAPSYIPFMEYADDRQLRETMYRAYMQKAFRGNDHDNRDLVERIVKLRAEKAKLLGYQTYAEWILEERMAERPESVHSFLDDLLEKALPAAKREVEELKSFMSEEDAEHALERWDWAYYSEKLRKKKFQLDDEEIKPYFKLENVIQGVFNTAGRLYDVHFVKNSDIPTYHPDVIGYEVQNSDGKPYAVLLADFFPREGKRPGAWMTSYRDEKKVNGERILPHISIVCNFTPSTEEHPSLLKFDEVKTLFHEFGHALHGMLADTTFGSLSGTSVFWDFVELPSQIFENWCYEKECLDLFAKHHQTGEAFPEEYLNRLIESSNFHEAYATVRQVSFGMLDLNYHDKPVETLQEIEVTAYEDEAFSKTDLFPKVEGTNMSVQFGHIFAGGYAAGYYSYKWAEVLDADAFAVFKEKGVFDKSTAQSFKENILSRGGTDHPMTLYLRFRGKKPTNEALLKRAGLV